MHGLTVNSAYRLAEHPALSINECSICSSFCSKAFYIDLCSLQVGIHRKTLAFCQQLPVLIDNGISTIDHVLCALTESTSTVNIAGYGTGTLLRQQTLKIGMFANKLVTGRKIENQVGSGKSQMITGRSWCPNILTDLNTKADSFSSSKQHGVGMNNKLLTSIVYGSWSQVLRRSEPALLIKFGIIGQISFRNDAQQLAFLEDYRSVEQQISRRHWRSYNNDNVFVGREPDKSRNSSLR